MKQGEENYATLMSTLRTSYNSGTTRSLSFRKQQLTQMLKMLEVHENDFAQALNLDLGKSRMEAVCFEVELCRNWIRGTLADIDNWAVDEHVEKNLVTLLDTTYIRREPVGVVLIMGAWNYPAQLSIGPVIGAIAAGNCLILKPSEVAPATAKVIEQLFPQFLSRECYKVVLGGVPETTGTFHTNFKIQMWGRMGFFRRRYSIS